MENEHRKKTAGPNILVTLERKGRLRYNLYRFSTPLLFCPWAWAGVARGSRLHELGKFWGWADGWRKCLTRTVFYFLQFMGF